MAELLKIEEIAPQFKRYLVRAPQMARKHRAGQFVIVLLNDHGERIPLTIADADPQAGTITLVVQEVGKTTMEMGTMKVGDSIEVVGPLGKPTHIENFGTVRLHRRRRRYRADAADRARRSRQPATACVSILGGRTKELIILRAGDGGRLATRSSTPPTTAASARRGWSPTPSADLIAERGKPGPRGRDRAGDHDEGGRGADPAARRSRPSSRSTRS